jgi:hypothetical protein
VAYLAIHVCLSQRNKRRDDARQVIAVKEVAYAGLQLCVCCYGHCVAFIAVLTFTPTWENSMIDENDTELDLTDPLVAGILSLAFMIQGTSDDLPPNVMEVIRDIVDEERN